MRVTKWAGKRRVMIADVGRWISPWIAGSPRCTELEHSAPYDFRATYQSAPHRRTLTLPAPQASRFAACS